MLKCSWAHNLSHLSTYCSFASIGHVDMQCSAVSSNYLHSLHILSVSVCIIFVARYSVCNAWSCAIIISFSVSLFISPLDSHSNMASTSISCLSVCLSVIPLYRPSVTFFPILWGPSYLLLCVECLHFYVAVSYEWFNSSAAFAAILIVEFVSGRLLSWY